MSEFQTALMISGSIFAVMMVSQFGRREYTWHKVLIPVVSVAAFGYAYLHNIPTAGADLGLYAAGIGIGAIFAVLATMATGVERDSSTGKLFTRCGAAFVVTWLVAMLLRIAFVWGVDNDQSFRNQVGEFMMNHHILETAIAPFFVIMALTTVVGRVVAVRIRMSRLTSNSTASATKNSTQHQAPVSV